jgi:transcriptional regulator with XRE-family HTH domain
MKATPTDARPYLARTLSRLRRQAGLSQSELALLADISRQMVSLIEKGQRIDLSWGTIQQLALALGVPTDGFRNQHLAAAQNGQRIGRKRKAPVQWLRFRYAVRFRNGDVECEEPFEGGGSWRSALVAGRDLLRAASTRIRLVRQRCRRDDP